MARMDEVKRQDLNARQQALFDDLMRTRPPDRKTLTGPFSVWIHTPDIAEHADRLVNCFRVNPKLDKRLIELIILMMCREATAKYAWSVHAPLGLKEGLTKETIDAIAACTRPDFKRDDEKLVYDFVTELAKTKTVSTATFERAKSAFGLEGVIEIVTCAGFYGMIGYVLNVFEIPPQAGASQLA
jgi:4-carboxymuconolactone decarboxylase